MFRNDQGILCGMYKGETVRIEAWGKDALRIRTTRCPSFTDNDWALSEEPSCTKAEITISADGERAEIINGRIRAVLNRQCVITFYKDETMILREYFRNYDGTLCDESRCLKYISREYIPYIGGDYRIVQKFDSDPEEKIFGMGQYQMANTNLKGCILDLEQRNSQISVPFMISNKGYGLLWNNPAVGRASFGMNLTEFTAEAVKQLDYWITAADTPKELLKNYTDVTGRAPQFPDDLLGLWQSKLRYRTQKEVLEVAHECRAKGVNIDVIVIDFFHWPYQGEWCFDKDYWPDPKAMIDELHEMGIKVCVSVWPSVDKRSSHFAEMEEKGLLIRTERGGVQTYDYQGDCTEIDATNPETREYVYDIIRRNYLDLGVDMIWLDNAEPDYVRYDFDQYRYHIGTALSCSCIWPQYFSRMIREGRMKDGETNPISLLRSGWAGSQKYGNVIWSGDVPSTFDSLRDQLQCGINMGLAGIPWWTTDIGGFMTDDVNDPSFRQLLVRWFEFAVFTGILRMHGDRGPHDIPVLDERDYGGGYLFTGQPNELWSYGEEVFTILKKNLALRDTLKDYIADLFRQASEDGSPLLRAMFYEFPEDEICWKTYDQYMFGSEYLVAPILSPDTFERNVYLPKGSWMDIRDEQVYEGGRIISAKAPLDSIPVFRKL
ncbi:MAG: glycoside hydrolase family 31 protein [Erysipelotrichaceae bacterium]|nr:glycoside hydrolase family 31 protein [Erysipelotrichaceae bacterium]